MFAVSVSANENFRQTATDKSQARAHLYLFNA